MKFKYLLHPRALKAKIYEICFQVFHRNSRTLSALITTQMIDSLSKPSAIAHLVALSRALDNRAIITPNENILTYLNLIRPMVAPIKNHSFSLTRIGGNADGGYVMLPPPPQ